MLAQTLQQLCLIDEALVDYDRALALQPGMVEALSFRLVARNYLVDSQAPLLADSRDFGARVAPSVTNVPRGSGDRRLRVGIVSPDLRVHSVTYFLAPIMQRCDPANFDVRLYYDHVHTDAMTQRLATYGRLTSVYGTSNEALERQLLDDDLDVVIDLAGHFGRNRMPVFARRVAPVQVAYLGYPNTTGVQTMDWRIADGDADGGCLNDFTERLAYMAHGMWAYEPPTITPAPAPTKPCLGYFGMLTKITPEVMRVWARIMTGAAIPEATLLVKGDGLDDPSIRDMWRVRFEAAGVPVERLILRGRTATSAEHLAMYTEVTVALDTWPYNGTVTTCEALWAGVPVVTLEGTRHAARVSAALLRGAGLGSLVARSVDNYVFNVATLLREPRRLTHAELAGATWLRHTDVAGEFWATIHHLHATR